MDFKKLFKRRRKTVTLNFTVADEDFDEVMKGLTYIAERYGQSGWKPENYKGIHEPL